MTIQLSVCVRFLKGRTSSIVVAVAVAVGCIYGRTLESAWFASAAELGSLALADQWN